MLVTPNFHFYGDCEKAIDLYKQAFDIQILCMLKNKDANPKDYSVDEKYAGYVYHAEVVLGGARLMMSDMIEQDMHAAGNSLSLVVTFDSAEQVQNAYAHLKDCAVIISPLQSTSYSSCFVSLIDKYGMRWELMTEQTER